MELDIKKAHSRLQSKSLPTDIGAWTQTDPDLCPYTLMLKVHPSADTYKHDTLITPSRHSTPPSHAMMMRDYAEKPPYEVQHLSWITRISWLSRLMTILILLHLCSFFLCHLYLLFHLTAPYKLRLKISQANTTDLNYCTAPCRLLATVK